MLSKWSCVNSQTKFSRKEYINTDILTVLNVEEPHDANHGRVDWPST